MKLNVEVNADDTVEELKTLADEFLVDLSTKYLSYLYAFIGILVIILVLTSCCGTYMAIWLHRSCHCQRFRCCFGIECDRVNEPQQHEKESHLRLSDKDDDGEIYV